MVRWKTLFILSLVSACAAACSSTEKPFIAPPDMMGQLANADLSAANPAHGRARADHPDGIDPAPRGEAEARGWNRDPDGIRACDTQLRRLRRPAAAQVARRSCGVPLRTHGREAPGRQGILVTCLRSRIPCRRRIRASCSRSSSLSISRRGGAGSCRGRSRRRSRSSRAARRVPATAASTGWRTSDGSATRGDTRS